MKNPIIDKTRPSLACLGMHYILVMALKTKLTNEWQYHGHKPEDVKITYEDIQRAMDSKFPPDQAHRKQMEYLVSYGYIKQETIDGKVYINLL